MSYHVKEMYYTLQGEGVHTGKPAVLVRFSGCNLWSGRDEDRESAICTFCDTDFVGTDGPNGGIFNSADQLASKAMEFWPKLSACKPFVVGTGGEPLLQLDSKLLDSFHRIGFEVAIETNGTLPAPADIDWICVSPKAGTELVLKSGNELKLVFPQPNVNPADYLGLEYDHFSLQPVAGPESESNTMAAIQYCLEHPCWKLSLQIQKILNIP
ncbi:MAG: 7-carboxy-7-deazaguanine synthase [Dehalococcoidia bacterium]